MNPRKRPLRDIDSDESLDGVNHLETKKARIEEQNAGDDLGPSAATEILEMAVKIASPSRAARNDPYLTFSQLEVYRKCVSELSSGHVITKEHLEMALTTALQQDSACDSDTSSDVATPDLEDDILLKVYEEIVDGSTSTIREKSQEVIGIQESSTDNSDNEHNEEYYSNGGRYEDEADDNSDNYEEDDSVGKDDDGDAHVEDRSQNHVDSKLEWMEQIDIELTCPPVPDESCEPIKVAHCKTKCIRRTQMRHDFYAEMERLSSETATLAFDLFDRYGRFRPEFKTHPIIKGTGVWGKELDDGDIILIEELFVASNYRGRGLGRKMVEAILTLVRRKSYLYSVFVRPDILGSYDNEQRKSDLQGGAASLVLEDRGQDRAVLLYRSLEFRRVGSTVWFATTWDMEHPSRKLASTQDIDPIRPPSSGLDPILDPFKQITNAYSPALQQPSGSQAQLSPEPDWMEILKKCILEKGADDTCWLSRNTDGNTVLHLAAVSFNVECVEWILNQNFGPLLLQARNFRGETPVESVEFKLEKYRTQRHHDGSVAHVSDDFKGYNSDAVKCLIWLKRLGKQEWSSIQRMISGCTCGRCVEAVLSPRMSHALHTQASAGFETLDPEIETLRGLDWVRWNDKYLRYLPLRVRNNLTTNKSMRQGFANLWKHVATCLEDGNIPDERNIRYIVRCANEWPPATRNFLQRGGSVESVVLAICRQAMEQDEVIGGGTYQETYSKEIAKLPECRNDKEFGYMSDFCGYKPISLARNFEMMGNSLDDDENSAVTLHPYTIWRNSRIYGGDIEPPPAQ